ncbi:hypothetical protein HK098_005401 [Nowakowskiella sp. JEL0407]|nr:hypothetical protein HK098_005401 [Nowakowskiella sp. JEL0407]
MFEGSGIHLDFKKIRDEIANSSQVSDSDVDDRSILSASKLQRDSNTPFIPLGTSKSTLEGAEKIRPRYRESSQRNDTDWIPPSLRSSSNPASDISPIAPKSTFSKKDELLHQKLLLGLSDASQKLEFAGLDPLHETLLKPSSTQSISTDQLSSISNTIFSLLHALNLKDQKILELKVANNDLRRQVDTLKSTDTEKNLESTARPTRPTTERKTKQFPDSDFEDRKSSDQGKKNESTQKSDTKIVQLVHEYFGATAEFEVKRRFEDVRKVLLYVPQMQDFITRVDKIFSVSEPHNPKNNHLVNGLLDKISSQQTEFILLQSFRRRIHKILGLLETEERPYFVDSNATPGGIGSQISPFNSIDTAVTSITSTQGLTGLILLNVLSGTYTPNGLLSFNSLPYNLTIRGVSATDLPQINCIPQGGFYAQDTSIIFENLIISACTRLPAITLQFNNANSFSILRNVKLLNGSGTTSMLSISQSTDTAQQVILQGCEISGNTKTAVQVGAFLDNNGIVQITGAATNVKFQGMGNILFDSCVMQDNSVLTVNGQGGVISAYNSAVVLQNCTVSRNQIPNGSCTIAAAYGSGGSVNVRTSNFTDSLAKSVGIMCGTSVTIVDSSFTNCTSAFSHFDSSSINIMRSRFTNFTTQNKALFTCNNCEYFSVVDSYIKNAACTTLPCGPTIAYWMLYKNTTVSIKNTVFENIAGTKKTFDLYGKTDTELNLQVDNCTFTNITGQRGIFYYEDPIPVKVSVRNTIFRNISMLIDPSDYVTPALLYVGGVAGQFVFVADNITTVNLNSKSMMNIELPGNLTIRNIYKSNMISDSPAIYFSTNKGAVSHNALLENNLFMEQPTSVIFISGNKASIQIRNCTFTSNKSKSGPAIRIAAYQDDALGFGNSQLLVENSKFIGNQALQNGGVFIFDRPRFPSPGNNSIIFRDNQFVNNQGANGAVFAIDHLSFASDARFEGNLFGNNTASMAGGIFYITQKAYCPASLLNIDQQQKMILSPNYAPYGAFIAGEPRKLLLNSNQSSDYSLTLHSGSIIPEVTMNLMDDFSQEVITPETNILPENLVVLSLESANNSVLINGGICFVWKGKCQINGQIIGNPGVYNLTISSSVTNFGYLKSLTVNVPLNLTNCPDGMVSAFYSSELPICRAPVCSQPCVFGSCFADETCRCSEGYEGPTCALQILSKINVGTITAIRAISGTVLGLIVISIILIFVNKNKPVIAEADIIVIIGAAIGNHTKSN